MPDRSRQFFCIGSLTLDLSSGRLIGPAGDVDIRPKTYAMLAHLARGAGKVVAKDELMQAIWPGLFVSEDSLTQCASDLRRVLGDNQSLLKTFPRRGYMLAVEDPVALPGVAPGQVVPNGSIAVLPFLPPDGATDRDRIMLDGLAHDITSGLAQTRSFHVTGRGSAFALRELSNDPARVRQLLRVAYVVTGRVVAAAGPARLIVDVVQTEHDSLVWTSEVEIDLARISEAAQEITARFTVAIAQAITSSEQRRALTRRNQPLAAWESLHLGLDRIFHFERHSMATALDHFTTAIELDPGFARAHAFQSFCHYHFAFADLSPDRSASARKARQSAERALDADDRSPTAHWAYGRALCLSHDPDGARRHCQEAVAISHSFPHAHYMLGFIEAIHGSPEAAFEHLDISESLSPLDPFNASVQLTRAVAHLRLGRIDLAATFAARTVRHRNVYSQMLYPAALILMAEGHEDEARAAAARIRDYDPDYRPEKLFSALYGLDQDTRNILTRAGERLGT